MVDRDSALAAVTAALTHSPLTGGILRRWDRVGLPQVFLAAGAVAQTVWNDLFGCEPLHGIDDVDIVYFDRSDLTRGAEEEHERRLSAAMADLGVRLDVKNEARVHLWYASRFGRPLAPYTSVRHAIGTFPTTATAVGVRPDGRGGLEFCAPFGLVDLADGVVRANRAIVTRAVYEAKCARWLGCWPRLRVIPWEQCPAG